MEIKKENSTSKPKTSNGGRGRNPRTPKNFRITTGGNSNQRNRSWIIKRILGRATRVIGIKDENENSKVIINDLPCEIYLDTDNVEVAEIFYKNFLNVLKTVDLELTKEYPSIKGSWIKKFWVGTKNFSKSEILTRLEKIERGVELQYIDKVQSEVDLNTANAIGILLAQTKDIPQFSSLVGSLLFAKTTINGESRIFAQTLTQDQLAILKENPTLIHNPFNLIIKMEESKANVLAESSVKKLEGE
ncbi:hypothetical protein [Flavobacterium sp. HBTb2-11-1]|uniref:hypothetical protein n=1 Tax=Flavobacterium sp. HBTb2-11-1 TaxID=2692212 RepID=UPI00136C0633|nr:hypothetical protein [Flavobacterium sp. HBTb2-11-1]MXO06820.1 hypothetical protein [Flavobacterium sp. HBTb2-11-1]